MFPKFPMFLKEQCTVVHVFAQTISTHMLKAKHIKTNIPECMDALPEHPMAELAYEAHQCRRWTWTMWDEPFDDSTIFSYIMYQPEICPKTGRLHFQGYLETHLKKTRKAVMTSLWGGIKGKHFWCTPSRGTAAENQKYCSKRETRAPGLEAYQRGSPFEPLERPTKRSRGEEIAREAYRLGKIPKVTEDNAWVITQYGRRVKDMLDIKDLQEAPPRVTHRDIECILRIGDTETGKSTALWAGHTVEDTYNVEPANGSLWWDGYRYQDRIVIDEFKGQIDAKMLNKILDKFPFDLQIKGKQGHAHWTKVEVASNYPINKWYSDPIEQRTVARRFKGRCYLHRKDEEPVLADPITGVPIPQVK